VTRCQALLRDVQGLEATNADSRRTIADLQAHAGRTSMQGPGVTVLLANGVPGPESGGQTRYLVNFQDVQDVVNLLFSQGAEGVSANGRRITPVTAYSGSTGEVA
jgi:uncharacterized protein YlxW (UPF0749 family)